MKERKELTIENHGNYGTASNSGNYGIASNSGFGGTASNSGDYGTASNSGNYGTASNSGNYGTASNSGFGGTASNSGDYGTASNSGDRGTASNSGFGGTAASFAPRSRVMGEVDGTCLIAGYLEDEGRIARAVTGTVGEDGIEKGVWYEADAKNKCLRRSANQDAPAGDAQ